jgi:hypothetical protein
MGAGLFEIEIQFHFNGFPPSCQPRENLIPQSWNGR